MQRVRCDGRPSIRSSRSITIATILIVATLMPAARPVLALPPLPEHDREARPDLVAEAWKRLDEWFYQPNRLSSALKVRSSAGTDLDESAQHAVIRRMLLALDASHTDLYTPDQPKYAEALDIYSDMVMPQREGLLEGGVTTVGVDITTREIDGRRFVRFAWEGGPADLAGVQIGDEIVAVDGRPFHPVHSFRDEADRTVRLTIRRARDGAPEHIDVVPHRVQPTAAFARALGVSARIFERGSRRIGYLRVHAYLGDDTHERVLASLEELERREAEALVLDLRGGWGGASPDHALAFCGIAPDMTMTDRAGNSIFVSRARVEPNERRWHRPLVVVIDETVRSGKEVLAATFRSDGVPLIGSRTAGAVLGGKPFLLKDDSLLIVAVTDVTVNGARLEGVGVEPTIAVPFELPYANGRDPQLDRAIAEAARLVGANGE